MRTRACSVRSPKSRMLIRMQFLLLASLIVLTYAAPCLCQGSQKILRLDGKTISSAQATEIAEEELAKNHVMGTQLAILNRGRTVWSGAFGLRDAAKKLPMTPQTNIWAASITKGLFATWVMRQWEQHRIDLDQPIAQMLPQTLDQYEPYRSSVADLLKDPRWPLLTPRILLAHTSGLSNLAVLTEPDKNLRLHFNPGSRFAYSGDGLNLLQFAFEQKLGLRLADAMQHDLFDPLGMDRTGMVWRPEFAADTALRYDANGKYLAATHRDNARAAGSMTSTARDLSVFLEALFAGKILRPSTVSEMLKPRIGVRTAHQFPTLAENTSDEGPQVGLAYGFGWGLLTHTRYGKAFFKEGHGDGAENYLICFLRSQTCMIMLTNSDNGELAFRALLGRLIADTVTPWEWEGYTREGILHNTEHTAN